MDQSVTKKFKELDGHAVEVGSFKRNKEFLTDRADENTQLTQEDHHTEGKNGTEGMRSTDQNAKVRNQALPNTEGEKNENSATPTNVVPLSVCPPYISTAFDASSAGERLHYDAMVLDPKQLKREKRKQANRESARRSRMRKQAEYDELVKTCNSLNTEKMDLKSELDQLKANAEKLRLENAALREDLKNAQLMQQGKIASAKTDVDFPLPNDAKDILSNLGSLGNNAQMDCETAETSSISETITKLHQLLESSSRTDAVAAR